MTNTDSTIRPEVLASHRNTVERQLLTAFHYDRFFGQPIAGDCAARDARRAAENDITVRRFAREAGRFAFYAGEAEVFWLLQPSTAHTMEVARIVEAFREGWNATQRIHGGEVVS